MDSNYCSNEDEQKVEKELQKNPKLQKSDLDTIAEWAEKQPHLPENIPKSQIVLFLHASRYSVQEAKTLLDNYYTLRTKYSQFFSQRDPFDQHLQEAFDVTANVVHGVDKEGRRVLWSKLLHNDHQKWNPTLCVKTFGMSTDIDQLENGTCPGYTLVQDAAGFTLQHAMKCSFANARYIINYVQTGSTMLIEKILLINMNPAAEKLLAILRPFINSELFNKITICRGGSAEEILKMIPEQYVPSDYGGQALSLQQLNDKHKKQIESHADWFKEEEKMRIREELRSEGLHANADYKHQYNYCIDGSFRSLSLD